MNDEPKENKCEAIFYCEHCKNDPCAFIETGKESTKFCKHAKSNYRSYWCNSVVAQTNKMVLLLQDAGFEVMGKG